MRSTLRCLALLPLLLLALARPAHADPMDNFTITGGGLTIDFALPASTTTSLIGTQFNPGPVPGTVNGVASTITTLFVFPGPCAGCSTIFLGTGSETLFIDLPALYELSVLAPYTETLTFLPGSYTAGTQFQYGDNEGPIYDITIAPEAVSATPEPSSLLLLATGSLALLFIRRHAVRVTDKLA